MEVPAKVSAKGQVTIPKQVRDALGITGGEEIQFRLEEERAVIARNAELLDPIQDESTATPPAPAPRRLPWDAARHPSARRHRTQRPVGAVVVRDTDGSPLTIELAEKSSQASRR